MAFASVDPGAATPGNFQGLFSPNVIFALNSYFRVLAPNMTQLHCKAIARQAPMIRACFRVFLPLEIVS